MHIVHSFVSVGKVYLPCELVTGRPMCLGISPLILDLVLFHADMAKFCIHSYHQQIKATFLNILLTVFSWSSIKRFYPLEETSEKKKKHNKNLKTVLEFTRREKDQALLIRNTAVKHQAVSPWIHVSQLRRNWKSYQQGTSNWRFSEILQKPMISKSRQLTQDLWNKQMIKPSTMSDQDPYLFPFLKKLKYVCLQ